MKELLAEVDVREAKVTWIALAGGGWKAVVDGIALPPHHGQGRTGTDALAEVLRMARATEGTR
jgi:hypothetical protein